MPNSSKETMTYQQLVTEMEKLPLPEQLSLLEVLAGMIGRQVVRPTAVAAVANGDDSLARVRGMLKPVRGAMPSDEELEADYTDYLLRK